MMDPVVGTERRDGQGRGQRDQGPAPIEAHEARARIEVSPPRVGCVDHTTPDTA